MNKRQKEVIQYQLDSEKKVLDQLTKQYQKALNDINTKIRILQSDELTQSRIYRIEHQKVLKKQVEAVLEKLHADEYTTIQQYLSDSYTDAFVGTAYDMFGQGVPLILPIDRNAAVKAVTTDSKISEGLYESLGVDTKKLKKTISAEITRGIASDMPHTDIARNIARYAKVSLGRAKTIVRTESHRIQQASKYDAQNAAKAKGANVVKQWNSTLDGDTRSSHRRLDGQIRELDEPFEIGGKKAMYPGDFGDPAEDCNCRCQLLQRSRLALDESELKALRERAVRHSLYEDDQAAFRSEKLPALRNFEEFKKNYLKAAEQIRIEEPQWITKKDGTNDFSVASSLVNTKKYHDKFEGLTSHKQANESLYQHSMKMLEHRDGTDREDMILLDSRTGKLITQNTTSEKSGRTGLTDEQYADYLKYNGSVTIIHNHPNSSRVSFTDIKTMFSNDKIDTIVAVGHDGSVYKVYNPNRDFDIEKFEELVYNRYVNIYQDAKLATIKMTDELYALGVFEYESR